MPLERAAHGFIDDNRIDEPEFHDAFNDLRKLAIGVNARITRIRMKAVSVVPELTPELRREVGERVGRRSDLVDDDDLYAGDYFIALRAALHSRECCLPDTQ
jgi:hypothetical protein